MPGTFTITSTTINACDATTGWSNDLSTFQVGDDFTDNRREGSNILEFDYNSTGWRYMRPGSVSSFSMLTNHIRIFLYYTSKAEVVFAASSSVVLRVYSDATPGTNWAEWDLTGHTSGAFFPKLVADWNRFAVSGDNPSRTNGTAPTYSAIQNVELRVNYNSANSSNDPDIGIDFWYYSSKVTVTSATSSTPADFASMQDWDDVGASPATDPEQAVIFSEDVFVRLWTGIDFGNAVASTWFASENEFIYIDAFSQDPIESWTVTDKAVLRLGKLDVQTQDSYAINGSSWVVRENPRDGQAVTPDVDLTVNSGGTLEAYATKFYRGRDITINGDADIRDCDFDFCESVVLNNASIELRNTKIHDARGSGYAGEIQTAPSVLENVKIFNNTRGMHFKATMEVTGYEATDNTYDLVVDNLLTVTLVNSVFDKDKILQV